MSGLSNINSVPTGTNNPSANNAASSATNEQIFDARNVNVNQFRVGGFQGEIPSTLPENFVSSSNDPNVGTRSVAEGDVDGPTTTSNSATGQGQQEEDEGELSDDEKVRRQRQAQWAAMVASGEIEQPSRVFSRPGHKITLPVETPKYY
ncbi:hypothetical protein BGZ95_006223 [Linnemannia exigua]|uniref:Uncharacterized protein n=1 Tax=Linnemannia exigua TaxID=604196 RepID=A0AAD4HBD3_9FUNG|nr:hypothetical protein BGZ95_006223 [Linnemannia exigua]